jgi:hypothetical protein
MDAGTTGVTMEPKINIDVDRADRRGGGALLLPAPE